MYYAFDQCSVLETVITTGWDVSGVSSFQNTFSHCYNLTSISPDQWDTSSSTVTYQMFINCYLFDQDIGVWDVSNVSNMGQMFHGVTIPTPTYDSILVGWDAQTLKPNVSFDAGNSKYSSGSTADTARSNMINSDGWNITDAGPV